MSLKAVSGSRPKSSGVGWSRQDFCAYARAEWPEPQIAIGWLRGILSLEAEQVMADLKSLFSYGYKDVPGTLYHRVSGRNYAWGCTIYDGIDKPNGEQLPALLDLSDTGLRSLERVEGSFFDQGGGGAICALADSGFQASRLDISIDFYGVEIGPFIDAFHKREYTPFRSGHIVDSSQREGGGVSLYLGSRAGGGSFMRIYEKGAQLGEKFPILRIEYQAMQSDAHALFLELTSAPDRKAVAAGVLGCVDFRVDLQRLRKQRNQSRALRHAWWQSLLDLAGEMQPYDRTNTRVVDIERMLTWLRLSLPRPLAKLQEMLGEGGMCKFLCDLATCERAKLTEADKVLIQNWKESRSPEFF